MSESCGLMAHGKQLLNIHLGGWSFDLIVNLRDNIQKLPLSYLVNHTLVSICFVFSILGDNQPSALDVEVDHIVSGEADWVELVIP